MCVPSFICNAYSYYRENWSVNGQSGSFKCRLNHFTQTEIDARKNGEDFPYDKYGTGVCLNAQGRHYDMSRAQASTTHDASGNRYTKETCKLLCSNTAECVYANFQMYQGTLAYCFIAPACEAFEARADVTAWQKPFTSSTEATSCFCSQEGGCNGPYVIGSPGPHVLLQTHEDTGHDTRVDQAATPTFDLVKFQKLMNDPSKHLTREYSSLKRNLMHINSIDKKVRQWIEDDAVAEEGGEKWLALLGGVNHGLYTCWHAFLAKHIDCVHAQACL